MKRLILFIMAVCFASGSAFAQKDTVAVQGFYEAGGVEGTLNDAIQAAIDGGTINNTVFKLTPYDIYVLNRSIFMDEGQNLDIWAPKAGTTQETAPPQIVWTDADIDKAYIIQTYGDLRVQNVWFRYADILGDQVSSSITFEDNLADGDQETGTFDGVLFDYAPIGSEAGGAVTVKADHFVGIFTNSYFRNLSDVHFQYYGRAVSFPYQSSGFHYDSLLFENTTFSNLSRIVMMEGNEFADNVHLNHVTLINSIEWIIQSGWLRNVSVTNSIFVNPNLMGYRAVDVCDDDQDFDDFEDGLCNSPGGGLIAGITQVDSFGFEVDFTDLEREIFVGYNVYAHEQDMIDWYRDCGWCVERIQARESDLLRNPSPYIGQGTIEFMDSTDNEGNKVFTSMNIDSANMWFEAPTFTVPASNKDTMMLFVEYKWGPGSDINWAYKPEAGLSQTWPLPEDMSYSDTEYMTAAMGGFPLGDLNWYPDQLATWEAQRDQEWMDIKKLMKTGSLVSNETATDLVPSGYKLDQNYPNPFNPSTKIAYTVPKAGNVSLKVFNALGQEVATLFEGRKQAGSHELTFDASGLTSGVYFYRLEVEDAGVSLTRKLTLIK